MHPVILLLLSSITTDWLWLLIFTRFLDHTQRRTTVGRAPLNEWSVRRRDLYLTTITTDKYPCPPTCWGLFFYLPLKIRRLRPGLNPRTWVPKASTLPLDHRNRFLQFWTENCLYIKRKAGLQMYKHRMGSSFVCLFVSSYSVVSHVPEPNISQCQIVLQ